MVVNKNKRNNSPPSGNSKYILISVILIIAGYLFYIYVIDKNNEQYKPYDPLEKFKHIKEPEFKMEGTLQFISKKDSVIKKIEIETADNEEDLEQGLMYRKVMEEGRGMLFIFPEESEQSFWMKNTLIRLDLIFVNSKKEIVKISRNTVPLSESKITSEHPVLYVVEVNSGFTDRYNIKAGDKINFELK